MTTYKLVMADPLFWRNYGNTVVYTLVATVIAIVLTTCFAYVLSKRHLKGRTLVGIVVFTMFFNGGLIPNYILINTIGFKNTIWAIVIPNAISVFNLLVMKAFFENFPEELEEAAAVDGLNTYGILLRIVLPLSKAVIATMVLFYAVAFWNSWFRIPLHGQGRAVPGHRISAKPDRRRDRQQSPARAAGEASPGRRQYEGRDDAAHGAADPLVYPFIQRYFVSGVMLGAVKG